MPSVLLGFDQSSFGGGVVSSGWGEVRGIVQQAPGEECQPFALPRSNTCCGDVCEVHFSAQEFQMSVKQAKEG